MNIFLPFKVVSFEILVPSQLVPKLEWLTPYSFNVSVASIQAFETSTVNLLPHPSPLPLISVVPLRVA